MMFIPSHGQPRGGRLGRHSMSDFHYRPGSNPGFGCGDKKKIVFPSTYVSLIPLRCVETLVAAWGQSVDSPYNRLSAWCILCYLFIYLLQKKMAYEEIVFCFIKISPR